MLPKQYRIDSCTKRHIIRFVLQRGRRIVVPSLIVFYIRGDVGKFFRTNNPTKSANNKARLCTISEKRLGNSVRRHYIKRVLENLLMDNLLKRLRIGEEYIHLVIRPKVVLTDSLSDGSLYKVLEQEVKKVHSILQTKIEKEKIINREERGYVTSAKKRKWYSRKYGKK